MPPVDDKDRYVMSDDERATIGRRTKRDTQPPKDSKDPKEKKPSAFEALWARIPGTWKALTLVATIFAAGVAGQSYLTDYTKRYVTHDELKKHTAYEVDLREQIRVLRENDAARTADIASIKDDTAAVREDIRTLLQYMLSNPPVRGKGKTK